MRFKDRVVIISGGGAGMGRAAAIAFAKEGARVVINDISEKNLQETAEEIRSTGGTLTTVKGDVTRRETIQAAVGQALEQYGRIDILFNYVGGNPGYAPRSPFTEQNEAFWDGVIALNLKSTMLLSRAVLDGMMAQKYGKIINTAAVAGKAGAIFMVPYSTVKGGIIAFTKALALEVAEYNINVNCICPGPIATPGSKTVSSEEEAAQAIAAMVPLKRIGRSEEVASLVLYLASDEASFITGQALNIDGGMCTI